MLYSPTSPAGSEASEPPSPGRDADAAANDRETEVTARLDTTEPAYRSVRSAKRAAPGLDAASAGVPCPVLLVGPRFDKEYPLHPNRWVKVGRSKKAQLMLGNVAVSRNHFAIRWDRHQRVVELKDTSVGGTLVNGESIKGERHSLGHADCVRVDGKNLRYDFLLDLRPVGLGAADPREEQRGQQRYKKLRGPALLQRRDSLKAQLTSVDAEIQKREGEAFEKEREFHVIAMRRTLRLKEDKQRQEDLEKYLKGKKALEEKLEESRKKWLERLEGDSAKNEGEAKPLMDLVGERQQRFEKLQLKKDELERTIHPERYAVADVSRVGSYSLDGVSPAKSNGEAFSRTNSEPPAMDDVAGSDEDPLVGLTGMPGKRDEENLMPAGQIESSSADEPNEPEPKRPKVETKVA
uniref:FHA domain-containing protein n=1 Tax=Alexandrium catenella TaxID=2925 RepID=A0A7S1M023_ALECA